MKRKFFNHPIQVDLTHYENIRNEIINFFTGNNDIVSIYEYGSVSAPGVSDLDLIFVLKESPQSPTDIFDLRGISKDAQSLVADGTVIKMTSESMENILFLDNLFPNKLLGKDLNIINPSSEEDKFIKLVSMIDWVPERILKLTRFLASDEININNSLCTLHSFCYSLRSLNKIIGEDKASLHIIQETARLRSSWLSSDSSEEDLINCIEDAIKVGYKRLKDYRQYLSGGLYYIKEDHALPTNVDLELYRNHFIRFVDSEASDNFDYSSVVQEENKYYVIISNYFLPHFFFQSIQEGMLSQKINSKFSRQLDIDIEIVNSNYLKAIKKKIKVAEENAQFLMRNDFKNGLLRFGFHF